LVVDTIQTLVAAARKKTMCRKVTPLFACAVIAAFSGEAVMAQVEVPDPVSRMPESVRKSIESVVVIAGQSPTKQEITGTYEKDTPGLIGGMDEGAKVGTISKEIGPVPVNYRIPIFSDVATIFGGLSGAAKEQLQDLRDEMTDDLAQTGSHPLTNDGMALDVFWSLQDLPNLESKLYAATTPIAEDTDAILYVAINGVEIDVQGKDAIITTEAGLTLHRLSDGRDVYNTVIRYQDRDELENWTRDDKALWRIYANYARHYLGRELSADTFKTIDIEHELLPVATDDTKQARRNKRQLVTESLTPTLAWELELAEDSAQSSWAGSVDESNIYYDLEIFDARQLVYAEEKLADPYHMLAYELEPCLTYSWSVRPSYHIDGDVKYGEWMRYESGDEVDPEFGKGIVGRKASDAPAYVQDFAELKIECSRR
jgi:hypothetical protein